jgi:hypothetical protein
MGQYRTTTVENNKCGGRKGNKNKKTPPPSKTFHDSDFLPIGRHECDSTRNISGRLLLQIVCDNRLLGHRVRAGLINYHNSKGHSEIEPGEARGKKEKRTVSHIVNKQFGDRNAGLHIPWWSGRWCSTCRRQSTYGTTTMTGRRTVATQHPRSRRLRMPRQRYPPWCGQTHCQC